LSQAEALEVRVIQSVAGLLDSGKEAPRRPFRAPHHTASYAALVGGGPWLMPGEVTLASCGVLFLDELPEFDRDALDALRQPLEEGVVTIARASGHVRYPARFQLVAAMNPCRCGYFGSVDRECRCSGTDAVRYVQRVSGPLIDRFDMRVEMMRVPAEQLLARRPAEASSSVAARIGEARALARERNGGQPNALLSGSAALRACALTTAAHKSLTDIARVTAMSSRGVHRVLRVARTIADLDGRAAVSAEDINAAAQLRQSAAPPEARAV
jgi:magnesium chelatase family protein